MLKLRVLVASCAILGFAADAFGQCVNQCATLVVGNQNGIRMHRGLGVTATDFPNIATGNVAGDALWKVYPCFVFSNGAGSMTLTGVEVPLIAGNYLAPGTTNIPDFELRPAILGGGGCLEPDFGAAAIATFVVGNINLPNGNAFVINVSLAATPVPNGDVAMVYLATAGETAAMNNHARAYRTTAEVNPTLCGFSGSATAPGPVVANLAPTDEVRFELAFLEPALQALGTDAAAQRTGTGAYFPVAGTSVGWRCESFDGWNKGQQGLLVLSTSGGVCPGACTLPDPFGGAACASLVFDGMTVAGLQIPGVLGPFLLTPATPLCGAAGFAPFADGTRDTPAYPVPAGLSGFTLYSAFASLCLTPAPGASIVTEFSNTVRMSFQ
ncbi:MAG TPA: hypothetical protein VFI25_07275 [Planctomycetota bacterium]|jgi:hypothetical protein|nr:hypothetical protein [Planctomycetota bacterium]